MDRFWVDYAGQDSAAKLLATHIQQVTGQTDLLDAGQNAIAPGKTVANVAVNAVTANSTVPATRFTEARVDASRSIYASTYTWGLCLTPNGGGSCAARPLVGANTSSPGFLANESGNYTLTLNAGNGLGTTSTATYTVAVPNKVPSVTGCAIQQSVAINAPLTIQLASCTVAGDGPSTLQVLDPTTLAWGTSVNTLAYSASVSGANINFTYTASATAPAHLNYRVCDIDGDCGASAVDVAIVATLTANPDSFTTTLSASPLVFTIPVSGVNSLTANDVILPTNDLFNASIASQPANGSVSPTTAARGSSVTYTSNHVSCDINGLDIISGLTCAGDPFTYSLVPSGGTPVSNSTSATVKVQATTSFSQGGSSIYSFLGGITHCESCHDGTDATATGKWTYSADRVATWNSIKQWASKKVDNSAAGNPVDAALYSNPCLGTGGGGSLHTASSQQLTPSQCSTVLQWIKEGANYR
jgi:hypothetical protein